jgi:uncharacterized membrane protein
VDDAALFGHLLGAFLFVSGTVVAGVAFEAGRRRSSPREIALLLGLARIGAALVGAGIIAVLAFGLWLVHLGGWGYGAGWVDTAIALFAAAVVLGGYGGQAPKRARQLATRLAADGQPVNDELRSLLANRAALLANYASVLLMIAILVLMVWKPGAAAEVAVLPVVANVLRSPLEVPPPITRHTPNLVSSFHMIGEIFDRAYSPGRHDALRNEETVAVPPGSAAVFELTAGTPGMYPFVDHALRHAAEGAEGLLTVTDQG